jgi:tetracycline 7-halogenase / FADH2 O2-dependent halogenase
LRVTALDCDVAIVGSGFGGSLLALILTRAGRRVVLVDRDSHPRFAVGESSTPAADLILRDLTRRYDLPRLAPLTRYGSWCRAYPHLTRGPKRGFSYFGHQVGRAFVPDPSHENELLVAASADEERSDTHWLRSAVDAFLVGEATDAGVELLDRTVVEPRASANGWRLEGARLGRPIRVAARFLVDASGPGGLLRQALGLRDESEHLATRSRALFGHFRGVTPWGDLIERSGASTGDHPFPCDRAALHHVFDGGWMWQLRFDDGVTSAGFAIDPSHYPIDPSISPEIEWRALLDRLPSVAEQFVGAELVAPAGGLRRTARLQRRLRPAAGPTWALLPHAVGFVDPLHSTGIALTMAGVERLAAGLVEHWARPSLAAFTEGYGRVVEKELTLIDQLIAGCYRAMGRFALFRAFSLVYFAAVTTWEARRIAGRLAPDAAFLLADDPDVRALVGPARAALERHLADRPDTDGTFEPAIARLIEPFNRAGLGDPAARHLYRHTAPAMGR